VQTYRRAARALVVAACSFASLLLISCQSNHTYPVEAVEGPELDIALSTDLTVPGDIDSIRIERSVPDIATASFSTEEHELGPTGLELPTTLHFSNQPRDV
jgi:hypothetical protein